MISKKEIMLKTNALLEALENCWDEELIDRVCAAVAGNEPFDEDEIAAAEEEE